LDHKGILVACLFLGLYHFDEVAIDTKGCLAQARVENGDMGLKSRLKRYKKIDLILLNSISVKKSVSSAD